jgi:excinuclease ABC subunit C
VLAERVEFSAERDQEIFASLPAEPAVFLLSAEDSSAEPYVSKSSNLRRRLERLLAAPEPGRKLNLRQVVRWISFTPTGSDFESGFLLYRLLRETFPQTYTRKLRLRFAPVIKLHLQNEYPRASVTNRVGRLDGKSAYYGPFLSRAAAEQFAKDSLDFFKMRRCIENLQPDPSHPGCIYSEMKMCLAPCFKGCTDEAYHAEVARVRGYLDTAGQSLISEISTAREQASTDLQFEEAAALHAKLDKLKPVLSQLPEIVRRVDLLKGVLVQPSATAGCVALFKIDRAHISAPIAFPIQSPEHTKSQSMEARIQHALGDIPPEPDPTTLEVMEHLAILKRWFYRGRRTGEIFLADESGQLPMRRLVRGISRVYRGEKPESEVSPGESVAPRAEP